MSVGNLRACVKVDDCCDTFFVGTRYGGTSALNTITNNLMYVSVPTEDG
jgi:hypothetical protein